MSPQRYWTKTRYGNYVGSHQIKSYRGSPSCPNVAVILNERLAGSHRIVWFLEAETFNEIVWVTKKPPRARKTRDTGELA